MRACCNKLACVVRVCLCACVRACVRATFVYLHVCVRVHVFMCSCDRVFVCVSACVRVRACVQHELGQWFTIYYARVLAQIRTHAHTHTHTSTHAQRTAHTHTRAHTHTHTFIFKHTCTCVDDPLRFVSAPGVCGTTKYKLARALPRN